MQDNYNMLAMARATQQARRDVEDGINKQHAAFHTDPPNLELIAEGALQTFKAMTFLLTVAHMGDAEVRQS